MNGRDDQEEEEEEEARAARAAELRKQIARLTKKEPDQAAEPGPAENPRDFVARRMRQLAEGEAEEETQREDTDSN